MNRGLGEIVDTSDDDNDDEKAEEPPAKVQKKNSTNPKIQWQKASTVNAIGKEYEPTAVKSDFDKKNSVGFFCDVFR